MCSFQLSDVSRMRPRYFRVNVNVAVCPSIMTGGRWFVSTVLLTRIITDVLVIYNVVSPNVRFPCLYFVSFFTK